MISYTFLQDRLRSNRDHYRDVSNRDRYNDRYDRNDRYSDRHKYPNDRDRSKDDYKHRSDRNDKLVSDVDEIFEICQSYDVFVWFHATETTGFRC